MTEWETLIRAAQRFAEAMNAADHAAVAAVLADYLERCETVKERLAELEAARAAFEKAVLARATGDPPIALAEALPETDLAQNGASSSAKPPGLVNPDDKWQQVGVLCRSKEGRESVVVGVARIEFTDDKGRGRADWYAQARQGDAVLRDNQFTMRRAAKEHVQKWLKDPAMQAWALACRDGKTSGGHAGPEDCDDKSEAVPETGTSMPATQAETTATASEVLTASGCSTCGAPKQFRQTADGWYCRNGHGPYKTHGEPVPPHAHIEQVSFPVVGTHLFRVDDSGSWYEASSADLEFGDLIYARTLGETKPLYFGKGKERTSVVCVVAVIEDGKVLGIPAPDWQARLKERQAKTEAQP